MPKHPSTPSIPGNINDLAARMRSVERLFSNAVAEITEVAGTQFSAYSWQSPFALSVMTGHRLYADRAGTIVFCRAERSAGDGTSTATFDVLKNGTSIFPSAAKPSVAASSGLGPERIPDVLTFAKGDYFAVEIEATGGGSGPLRVTIKFIGAA